MKEFICPTDKNCEALGQVGDIFGGINALFAALALAAVAYTADQSRRAYKEEQQRNHDAEYLPQIKKSYEWAYLTLTVDGINGLRESRRIAWLTAARHLRRAEALARSIQTPVFQTIQSEEEEYWQHKFYLALSQPLLSKASFFGDWENAHDNARIEPTSAAVVAAFSRWKEDAKDPLADIDIGELLERDGVIGLTGPSRGLDKYIRGSTSVMAKWNLHRAMKGLPPEPPTIYSDQ